MREILLATGNPNKAREIQEILSGADLHHTLPIRWRTLAEFPQWPEPVEDGDTFLANAQLKARFYAQRSGLWTVADDSGLEVDALGGEPGVRSARFAGEPSDSKANNLLLIQRLAAVPPAQRTARFRCAIVLADAATVIASAEGAVEGRIIDQPLGSNGFGYDPHFWYEPAGMTTAQMSSEAKHAISHRGQALRQLREQLVKIL